MANTRKNKYFPMLPLLTSIKNKYFCKTIFSINVYFVPLFFSRYKDNNVKVPPIKSIRKDKCTFIILTYTYPIITILAGKLRNARIRSIELYINENRPANIIIDDIA